MRIAIIGSGAWGTALAISVAARHSVALYGRHADRVEALRSSRENSRYLAGFSLPSAVDPVSNLEQAVAAAELVVVATPVAGLRAACESLRGAGVADIAWLCKGFEDTSGKLPHQVVAEVFGHARGAVLSGPSFAQEVAGGLPTALTAAATMPEMSQRLVDVFHAGALRVYRSDDVVGVEVGGAVKNVLAIATGIADGLSLGMNARAALITRGLNEMMRLGVALGGRQETLIGLTGMGDLILTCTGSLSRNRRVGLELAAGQPLDAVLASIGHVAEGVRCARTVRDLARRHHVEMPITDAVCQVMFEQVSPRAAVSSLLARQSRTE